MDENGPFSSAFKQVSIFRTYIKWPNLQLKSYVNCLPRSINWCFLHGSRAMGHQQELAMGPLEILNSFHKLINMGLSENVGYIPNEIAI